MSACGAEPEPTVDMSTEADVTPQLQEVEIDTGDVTLFARSVGGPGSLLVGVHGGGVTSHYMEPLPSLPGQFIAGPERTFVTYDQRGGGRSSVPASGDYAFARHVEDLEALRALLDVEKLHLFCHSYGAAVATAYALEYPERVGSLIFFGGVPPTSDGTLAGMARQEAHLRSLQEQGVIADPLPPPDLENDNMNEIVAATAGSYFADPQFAPPSSFGEMNFRISLQQGNLDAHVPFDWTEQVGSLRLPVLLLFGEEDPFGLEFLRETESAFSGADVTTKLIPGCGHFFHECWDETAAALEPFLDAVMGGSN